MEGRAVQKNSRMIAAEPFKVITSPFGALISEALASLVEFSDSVSELKSTGKRREFSGESRGLKSSNIATESSTIIATRESETLTESRLKSDEFANFWSSRLKLLRSNFKLKLPNLLKGREFLSIEPESRLQSSPPHTSKSRWPTPHKPSNSLDCETFVKWNESEQLLEQAIVRQILKASDRK